MLRSFLARLGGLCLLALLAAGCQRTLIFPSTPTSPAGSTSGAAERTATVTQIKGTVETRSSANAAWKAGGLNQVLAEGTQVRTGADGSAVITLTEGTHIYVGANTQFTLTLLNKFLDSLLTTLDLQQGQLWVALNGGALDIQTPFGIASARNAYLSVELVPQSRTINVTCLQGVCGFGSILIPNGYKLINAADNQSPAKMQMADYGVWGVAVPEATQLAFLATEAVVQGSATIPAVLSPTSSPSPQPSATPQPTTTTTPTAQPTATTAATATLAPAATSTGAAATDTETSVPPTDTPLPPTDTPQPPTDTPVPSPTLPQFLPTVTPVPITPVPPAPIMGTHLVLPGETVFCIARGYGVLPAAIAQANGLSQELLIYSGQVLRIPEVQWVNIVPGPVCPPQFASLFPGLPVIPTATATPIASPTPAGPPLTLSLTWHCVQNCNSKQGSYVVRVAAQAAGGIAPYTYTPGQTYDVTVAHCTTGQGAASVTSADGQTAQASWTFHDTACP